MKDQKLADVLNTEWGLPPGVRTSVHTVRTSDGAAITGFLYLSVETETVLCLMHPREVFATHYLIPELLLEGYAVWAQTTRAVGSDLRLEHEIAVLDAAAGTSFLYAHGFKRIILVGISGGASLYALYNEQSLLSPESRIETTPAGRPTKLASASLPQVAGLALVAPHPGQGVVLQNSIDPAVLDESDPLSTDTSLNFLDPRNGYKEGPTGSSYSPDFVARFQDGQRARVERLDQLARSLCSERRRLRAAARETAVYALRAAAAHTPVMTVWRTDADLRCWDLSLDPSERGVGSVWGPDPFVSNFGVVGAGRFCTPEAWLSTWSGITSRANLFRTASAIEQPLIQIEYTGDNAVFPEDGKKIFSLIRSSSKERHMVRGDHHGRALQREEQAGRMQVGRLICHWVARTF
jgi:pimeloyl-ACP methyl ester carboxylesterase